jgi:hypothetical protein
VLDLVLEMLRQDMRNETPELRGLFEHHLAHRLLAALIHWHEPEVSTLPAYVGWSGENRTMRGFRVLDP